MSALFTPVGIRDVTLPNRIVVSPMCQYSAIDGAANAWHLIHLGSLSLSGAGLLCLEATAVEANGRITPGDLGIWDERTAAALEETIAHVREYSRIPLAVQLAHAGRKASCKVPWQGGQAIPPANGGWVPDAPSPLPHHEGDTVPHALEPAELERVRRAFVEAARRAVRIGIDAIELHAAHGYLLHEFLSPIANRRTDQYGGSLENRMRFPLEVFDAVRAALPSGTPLGIKISAMDWVEGGWDVAQSVALAGALASRGVDWITASGGGISPLQKITPAPDYQVPFADAIRARSGVRAIAVGLITEPLQAEGIIASGKADLVALGRAMLYDPRWPWHAAAQLGAQVEAPAPYWRAPPQGRRGLFVGTERA